MSNIPDRLASEDSDQINRLPIESEDEAAIPLPQKRKATEQIDDCVGEVPLIMYSSINGDRSPNSFPEDIIVAEILPRLSIKTLFRFKCVSKRYESIISDPKFGPSYLQPAYHSLESWSSLGVFSSLLFPFTNLSPEHNVGDLTAAGPERPLCSSVSLPHDNKSHNILGSSNGLILSSFYQDRSKGEFGLCISNPLTKQCVQLPNSTILTGLIDWFGFGIATRRSQAASSLLTYKIVSVRWDEQSIRPPSYAIATVEIFSSDTGRWVARKLSCPGAALFPWNWKAGFAYKGILHLLHREMGTIITYDPFDSPDRFGSIRLPKGYHLPSRRSCRVYSGDQEMMKYCEIERPSPPAFDVNKVSVWRLVDSGKGEWCLESKFEVLAMPQCTMRLMVAPNPWKRHLIYYPYVQSGCLMYIDSLNRNRKFVKVVLGTKHEKTFDLCGAHYPFIFIQTYPWSSPFYALSR